jgi:hypothetical protein
MTPRKRSSILLVTLFFLLPSPAHAWPSLQTVKNIIFAGAQGDIECNWMITVYIALGIVFLSDKRTNHAPAPENRPLLNLQ